MMTKIPLKIANQTKIEGRKCPCCGRTLLAFEASDSVTISCPKGCRIVTAANQVNALAIWNEKRFTDPQ